MMNLFPCDQKLAESQFSPTHASTKKKTTKELKHNAEWYGVREGSPVDVQWALLHYSNCSVYVNPVCTVHA